MAYFDDLTKYEYCGYLKGIKNCLNVGWLSKDHEYNKGLVDKKVLDRLKVLAKEPTNLCRGSHECEFGDGSRDNWGNGEIWVKGLSGIVYSAPVMIVHYIEVHGYRPPVEFLEAVLRDVEV